MSAEASHRQDRRWNFEGLVSERLYRQFAVALRDFLLSNELYLALDLL